ncbi:uncharacterized protein LOC142538498 [Primulina tabacum]|uniref:uncharacterized protein LOC142538498 n=1 Tax=Primulina tabacum TaxID=48773 RepID=UPI003F5A2E06
MASTVFNTPPTFTTHAACLRAGSSSFSRVLFSTSRVPQVRCRIRPSGYDRRSVRSPSYSRNKFLSFAANEENVEVQTDTPREDLVRGSESESELELEGNIYGAIADDASGEGEDTAAEPSSVIVSLNLYKEALVNNDESKAAKIESFLKSIEDEKIDLGRKVLTLSEELSNEKDRILRISADFDNFRKRTERERLSLVKNAQGEVMESLLSVLDNFERAKAQIKVETEEEEKIVNSYQSIYKQFIEIMGSLGVVPLETVGKPFDPMVNFQVGSKFSRVIDELVEKLYKLHEAIMREDSMEYEEDVVIEEYKKGFQLGERLLRPSMVKVSAGPGPAKLETGGPSENEREVKVTDKKGKTEATVAEE